MWWLIRLSSFAIILAICRHVTLRAFDAESCGQTYESLGIVKDLAADSIRKLCVY
jgi:hypothetical protein